MKTISLAARIATFVICTFAIFATELVLAEDESLYLRLRKGADGELQALETGVVTFSGVFDGRPVSVDLISAVHVGEKAYYETLNSEFAAYDAVLYELIISEGDDLTKLNDRPKSILSSLQGGVKDLLALEFQLDQIDYQKKNMVHADLSAEAFMERLSHRGDSVWTFLARALAQAMEERESEENSLQDLKLIMALLASDGQLRAYKMRRYLAGNFGKVDDLVARLEGPDGSALVADRNARAAEVLQQQLKAGKSKLAIFYGGAHMPDLERRILADYPFKRTGNRWIVAWALQPK